MRGIVLALATLLVAGAVRGDVLVPYDNLGTNGGYNFGTHDSFAQSFTAGDFSAFGGTLAVKTIRMNLFIRTNRGSDTTFDVGIYSNVSSQPGSLVSGTLFNSTSSNLGTTASDVYSIDVSANNFVLASNTTYWLRVTRGSYSSSNQDEIGWATGASGAVGSAKESLDSGASWSNLGTPSTDQFGGQIVMVPEPGTLLLGGIAAVCGGGGAWWRRKRKAEVVETLETVTAV